MMSEKKVDMSRVIAGIRDNCNELDKICIEDQGAFWTNIDLDKLSDVAVKLLAVKFDLQRAIRAQKRAALCKLS